jgi:hypothetical protein
VTVLVLLSALFRYNFTDILSVGRIVIVVSVISKRSSYGVDASIHPMFPTEEVITEPFGTPALSVSWMVTYPLIS